MSCTECDREQTLHGLCLSHLKASLRPQAEEQHEDEQIVPDSRTSDEEEE